IKDCPEITDLYTSYNKLTELDISELKNLEVFAYSDNNFSPSKMDEFKAKKLAQERANGKPRVPITPDFLIDNDKITEVDISNETVDNCGLTELVIENCPNLKHLSFAFNKVKNIDLTGLKNLEKLRCSSNKLTKLDLRRNKKTKGLLCDNNPITKLELKHLKKLESLYCFKCNLNELDVTGLKDLKELYCANNNSKCYNFSLKKIGGLTTCESLIELDCAENSLTELEISNLKNLEFVSCKESQISKLKVDGCSRLTYLDYSVQKSYDAREIHELSESFKQAINNKNLSESLRKIVLKKVLSRLEIPLSSLVNMQETVEKVKKCLMKKIKEIKQIKNLNGKDVPEFEEYLKEKNLRQRSSKNKIKRVFKKYYSNFEKLKDLLNPAKTLQELEEA
ncbi:29936_t:CDS:2, partial [Racocetra persica]